MTTWRSGGYSYTFDDVLIKPEFSDINSRTEISTAVSFLGRELALPFISANMDYVTEGEMLRVMTQAGGLGILHRFWPWDEQLRTMSMLVANRTPVYFSIGVRDVVESLSRVDQATEKLLGSGLEGVCIDVAHGHHQRVADLVTELKRRYGNGLNVIAGNVATSEGTRFLYEAGADVVKVGIGAGSVCTTRTVAGVGVPQLSAIMECASFAKPRSLPIIADGGIRHSGDIAKAIAAGATTVMLGNLLAGTDETPGEMFVVDGKLHKRYRGQASFGSNGERYVKEGIEGMVPSKGPTVKVLSELHAGLRSAMSYVGARTIEEFQGLADFIEVSPHTLTENSVRVTERT